MQRQGHANAALDSQIQVSTSMRLTIRMITTQLISFLVSSTFDLYTKSDDVPDIQALMPYYQSLINKYIPGIVRW